MLVVTRKEGQVVVIGDGIRVKVVGFRGRQVRLAFDAPEEVGIYREEDRAVLEARKARALQGREPEASWPEGRTDG